MKPYAFACAILCAVLFFASCAKTDIQQPDNGPDTRTPAINNADPYDELITTECSIHDFIAAFTGKNVYGQGTMAEVDSCMPIECLRFPEGGTLYSIHKVREGGVLYIFYETRLFEQTNDLQDATILRWFYVQKNLSSDDYKDAQSIKDIAEIDATGEIFENICYEDMDRWSADDYRFASWHYVSDGIYEIAYEYKNGELKIFHSRLLTDFSLENLYEPTSDECTAKIWEFDWVNE